MNATDLGNKPASEMTYRQWLVKMATQGPLSSSQWPTFYGGSIADNADRRADSPIAREAQEASDERG